MPLADMRAFRRWLREAEKVELEARIASSTSRLYLLSGTALADANRLLKRIVAELAARK